MLRFRRAWSEPRPSSGHRRARRGRARTPLDRPRRRPSSTRSSTTTHDLNFSSRLFGRVARAEGGVAVERVGVPVINDKPSCPPLLRQQGKCEAVPFYVQGDDTPAQPFRARWGVDISGQAEADMITGIFAELS